MMSCGLRSHDSNSGHRLDDSRFCLTKEFDKSFAHPPPQTVHIEAFSYQMWVFCASNSHRVTMAERTKHSESGYTSPASMLITLVATSAASLLHARVET